MPPLIAVLAAQPDLFSGAVRAELRSDMPRIVIGILMTGVGLSAVLLFKLRGRGRDPALLWFGLFAGMYGARLLVLSNFLRFTAAPVPNRFWAYLSAAITYAILLPGVLFLAQIFPSWRLVLQRLAWVQALFAATGIAFDLVLRRPLSIGTVNNIEVILVFAALLVALVRARGRTQDARVLEWGTLALIGTVLANNLVNLFGIRTSIDPEPFGMAVFVGGLARVVVLRIIEGEERLASIEKELEIARRIQSTILPQKAPRAPDLEIAARYLPMAAVAGDFYDFLAVDEQRLGVLVADVSGHGVPAALIASMVKVAIAGQLAHASDPARVLTGMNHTLSGKLKGQFVTAAYLYLDVAAGIMRYASAGHPPLLWRSAGLHVEPVSANGLALGLRPRSTYKATERPVLPGERFLLYTDGLLEARNPAGEMFAQTRLRESLATAGGNVEEFASSLLRALHAWTGAGAPQTDDLTLVVIDVTAPRAPGSMDPTPPGE